MNVNAVGPSDSTDIRKAAIEAAMLDKEPSDVEVIKWIFETFPNPDYSPKQALARLCADRLESAVAQIKSQAERIAELEKDSKRLDWIESSAVVSSNLGSVKFTFTALAAKSIGLRSVIDAAMNERKE